MFHAPQALSCLHALFMPSLPPPSLALPFPSRDSIHHLQQL
uniref:Uncharacterized protein n=1 Tax=Brassica campestris TaxID=3711 RepID=A0A3P6AH75_BRACM|nr:unnamed protein product [Brassica rapa]